MKKYALYDNAGTTFAVPQQFYAKVITLAPEYVNDKRTLDEVLHNIELKKEGKERTTPQDFFDIICNILVKASEDGKYNISGESLLYPDTIEQLRRNREVGGTALLTSGTEEYTKRFLDFEVNGKNTNEYFDLILTGSQVGDKDDKKTFIRLYDDLEGGISSVFDDKITVARAALLASKDIGIPFRVYLVDRKEKYANDTGFIELQQEFPIFGRIKTFDDLEEIKNEIYKINK